MLVIAGVTIRVELLLGIPPTVTTTLPVGDPLGTANTIAVSAQLCGVIGDPLNVTVLVP
jgi:hypothetical protein